MTWRERIARAYKRGGFSEKDVAMAKKWATCAVGEQRKAYGEDVIVYGPRWKEPEDDYLCHDGVNFFRAVRENRITDAEALLDAIEDRALAVKRGDA